jgi:hypothetical protein
VHLSHLAALLAAARAPGDVVCLFGAVGAGKSVFRCGGGWACGCARALVCTWKVSSGEAGSALWGVCCALLGAAGGCGDALDLFLLFAGQVERAAAATTHTCAAARAQHAVMCGVLRA